MAGALSRTSSSRLEIAGADVSRPAWPCTRPRSRWILASPSRSASSSQRSGPRFPAILRSRTSSSVERSQICLARRPGSCTSTSRMGPRRFPASSSAPPPRACGSSFATESRFSRRAMSTCSPQRGRCSSSSGRSLQSDAVPIGSPSSRFGTVWRRRACSTRRGSGRSLDFLE